MRKHLLPSLVALSVVAACSGVSGNGFGPDAGRDASVHKEPHDGAADAKDGSIILAYDTGAKDGVACTGIACDVEVCAGGSPTTVSGYVYAPDGKLPLYDVTVFIPNAALAPLAKGVQCENCGAPLTGEPITTALTDEQGHFTLVGVPTGTDIPIVVQLGKWRRQTTIPKVTGCSTTTLTDPDMTRLPKNQMEGNMPHVALTTGGCDQMGCMLTKLGIDDAEFGSQKDGYSKAIHVYQGSDGGNPLGATAAQNLWGDMTNLYTYDEAIFSCECQEALSSKGGSSSSPDFGIVTKYLDAGGRIFTTDFQYTWYKYSPDPNIGGSGGATIGLGEIQGGAPIGGSPMTLVTDIPKAVSLAAWLKYVFSGMKLTSGATYPIDKYAQKGEVEPDVMFSNIQSLDPTKTVTWANSPSPTGPRVFTVDTPVGVDTSLQCGRGLHIDAHVDNDPGNSVGPGYPASGCDKTLKADEAMFAFFFFDLSSCISNEKVPPVPPPPVK